jgi:hypothetical protein
MRRRSPGRYEIRKKGKCWNVYFIRKKALYDIEKMEDDQRSGQFLPSRYYKNPKSDTELPKKIDYKFVSSRKKIMKLSDAAFERLVDKEAADWIDGEIIPTIAIIKEKVFRNLHKRAKKWLEKGKRFVIAGEDPDESPDDYRPITSREARRLWLEMITGEENPRKKLTLRQIRYKYRQERLAQKCRTKGCPGVPHGGSWPYCRDCQDEMNYGEHDCEEENPKVLPLRIKAGKRIVEAVTSKVPQPYLTPKVIYFDSKHRPVRYRMVDSSGKVIKKYFWRFVDKQGNFLTPAQIKPFVKIKGKLKPAKKYSPTLGSGGMMEVLKLIPASRERNYVFTTAYSMKGRSKMFYKFMDYLIAKKKVAIVPLVYRAGFQYHFGLLSPRKNESGQYSIMLKAISQKIKPDWHSIAKAEVPVQHKSQAKRLKKKMKRVI